MQQVKDYFQMTSTDQKKYIENLLVDFAQYLQQQRNDDLQLVQTRMNSLEQNTHIFKQETEQILSSIITTVGTPGSTETKN
jgi:methionyl-tRNA synthetase